jgi:hypothetical protein
MPKTKRQARISAAGGATAVTGVIVWAYPAMRAANPHWPTMTPEAAWAMTVLISLASNFVCQLLGIFPPRPTATKEEDKQDD